jgi:hypothetical protein
MAENLENIKNKYGENIDYVNASLKLINKAVEKLNDKNKEQNFQTRMHRRISEFQFNKNDSLLNEINDLLLDKTYVEEFFPFLLDTNKNIVDDKKKILLTKVNKVLEILDSDLSIPSWIEYFKSWLYTYKNKDYELLNKMGIKRYKKNIKGIIYKAFLENDPNLKYLISVTGTDEDPISSVENTFAELKSTNNNTLDLKLNENNSEDFLNQTITTNQYKLKKDSEVVPKEVKIGGKNKIKSKTKKIKRHIKSYKKSHKNPHKNKKPK